MLFKRQPEFTPTLFPIFFDFSFSCDFIYIDIFLFVFGVFISVKEKKKQFVENKVREGMQKDESRHNAPARGEMPRAYRDWRS